MGYNTTGGHVFESIGESDEITIFNHFLINNTLVLQARIASLSLQAYGTYVWDAMLPSRPSAIVAHNYPECSF